MQLVGPFASQATAYAKIVTQHKDCIGLDRSASEAFVEASQFKKVKATVELAEQAFGLLVLPMLCDPGRGVEVAYLPTYRAAGGQVWAWPTLFEPYWYTRNSEAYAFEKPAYNQEFAAWTLLWREESTSVPYDDCAAGQGECDATKVVARTLAIVRERAQKVEARVVKVSAATEREDVKTRKKGKSTESWDVAVGTAGISIDGQAVGW